MAGIIRYLGTTALFVAMSPVSGAIPIVNASGQITGATGVNLAGSIYDVTFLDGTCAEVFTGCDDAGDFLFDIATAQTAGRALLDEVFLDSAAGQFDSQPSLTFGCGNERLCYAFIPTSNTLGAVAGNRQGTDFDNVEVDPGLPNDTSGDGQLVWARFTLAQGVVPEPATWAMLLVGFGLIGQSLRLRSRPLVTLSRPTLRGLA